MNKFHVIAFVATAFVSTATAADAQARRPDAVRGQRAERGMERGIGGAPARGLFRGLTLSDAEKAKVRDVHAKYRTEASALAENLRPTMKEARTARQKGDTVAAKAALERTKGDREKLRALMGREKTELRAALSVENQKQFDANVKQVSERRGEGRRPHDKKNRRAPNSR